MLRRRWSVALFAIAGVLLAEPAAHAQRRANVLDECIDAAEDTQRQRQAGHLVSARARAEQCLDARCPSTIRHDCDVLRAEMARRIPSVVLRVRDSEGRDLPGAAVRFDDAVVPIDGRAKEIDPGPHEIVASAPGFVTSHKRVIVEEGVIGEPVELRLVATPLAATVSPLPAASHMSRAPVTWIASGGLAAVGLVGLGLFAGLGLSTDADYRALRDRCEPLCTDAERDSIHRRFQVVDVALAVGIVASVAAVVVYLVGPTRSEITSGDRGRGGARDP